MILHNIIYWIAGIAWVGCLLYLFISLRKRVRRLKDSNDTIYRDEHEKHLESFYKFDVETEEEVLINWKESERFEGDGTSYMKTTFEPSSIKHKN